MLQQTQVATAVPYYERFLERFPDIAALAAAPTEEVLTSWGGLGYYRRARHLHEAAKLVVRDHAARVPQDPDRFGQLPGVGRYTTGAVLSMSFDKPLAVLDGNVARVLSRLYAIPEAIREPAGARRLWKLADSLVPMHHPGDWNQALMELGATLCVPRSPRCGECPVTALCEAHRRGEVDRYPPVPARRAPRVVRRALALVERSGKWLMVPRKGRLLGGLWEPPTVETEDTGARATAALRKVLTGLGLTVQLRKRREEVRHALSHRDFRTRVWDATLLAAPERSRRFRWVDPDRPVVPVTGLVARLREVLSHRTSAAPRKTGAKKERRRARGAPAFRNRERRHK